MALKPTLGKFAVLIIVVLISGIPSTVQYCQSKVLTDPPCIERFTFANIILDALGLLRYTDAPNTFVIYSYNSVIVAGYLIALYVLISLVFYAYAQNAKSRSRAKSRK